MHMKRKLKERFRSLKNMKNTSFSTLAGKFKERNSHVYSGYYRKLIVITSESEETLRLVCELGVCRLSERKCNEFVSTAK